MSRRLNVLPSQFVIFDMEKREVVKNYEVPTNCNAALTLKDDPDHVILLADDVYQLNIKNGEIEKVLGILHPEEGKPKLNSLVSFNNRSPGDHGLFSGPAYAGEERLKILDPGDSGLALGTVLDQGAYVEAMQKVMMAGGKPPVGAPLMFYMIIDGKGDVRLIEAADHFAAIYSSVVSPDAKYLYAAMDELYKVDMKTGQGPRPSFTSNGARSTPWPRPLTGRRSTWDLPARTWSSTTHETMKKIGVIPLKSDGVAMNRITK